MANVYPGIRGQLITVEPKSTYTNPLVNDIVKWDLTTDYDVVPVVNNDGSSAKILGVVRVVSKDKTQLQVEQFNSGATVWLPYTSTITLGNGIKASAGTTVKDDAASGGIGRTISANTADTMVLVQF